MPRPLLSAAPLLSLLLSLLLLALLPHLAAAGPVYNKLETSFDLPQLQGNPFDFTQNDVKVTLASPDGRQITLPAFFDGGHTWRARHTPDAPGQWTVRAVTLNAADAQPQSLTPREFTVADQQPRPGFVRLDPNDRMRFVLDDGSPYYPLGYNLAWRHMGQPPMPPLVESLARMGRANVNWTRIWMNHWDAKNLDWSEDKSLQPEPGKLSLPVAKTWDEILAAAESNGVYLQLVLQHHGQYSSKTDSNWAGNPWNKANGGWLESPVQFFSDPKAIAQTKAKYRYIIARYGYSPAVMAWELFNEVEYTDAFEKDLPAVAAWHADMAQFLREQDPYKHLVTTSSRTTEPSLWPAMDYYQSHVYPPDILSSVQTLDAQELDRAYFYGEIGGAAFGTQADPGDAVHRSLWGSLMSRSSGAAQYWFWYLVEPENLLPHFSAAQGFVKQSGLLQNHRALRPIEVPAETPNRVALRFGPGTGWAPAKGTDFTVKPSGLVEGLGGMSAYLQGNSQNRKMFPFASINVTYPTDGTFAVRIDETTVDGARLELSVDGRPAAALDLGATPPPATRPGAPAAPPRRTVHLNATLELPIPAGQHTVRLENTGPEWVHLREFVLTPYTAELAVLARGNTDAAVLWVYRRTPAAESSTPVSGTLHIPGLNPGTYRVVWWDTYTGQPLRDETATVTAAEPLQLPTPPITRDVALWIAHPPQ